MRSFLFLMAFFFSSICSASILTDTLRCDQSAEYEAFSYSFNIPEFTALSVTYDDPVGITIKRARCSASDGTKIVDLHVTVSPETPGRSQFLQYEYTLIQGNTQKTGIFGTTDRTLFNPKVYTLWENDIDYANPFTLIISRDCKIPGYGCVDSTQWQKIEFSSFGSGGSGSGEGGSNNGGGSGNGGGTAESTFNITGFWYDSTLAGEGFNFAKIREETHIYYYGYTAGGQRLWLISNGGKSINKGEKQTFEMLEITNGTFDVPSRDLTNWGTLELTMSDCSNGTAKLTGKDGTKQFNLGILGRVDGVQCQ
jgi:hypothetical protein